MFGEYGWKDCLAGIEITFPKNPVVSSFVYEYISTKDQTSPVYWDHTPEIPEQISGADNYYNHYIYSGWQHWGMGIGNLLSCLPSIITTEILFLKAIGCRDIILE